MCGIVGFMTTKRTIEEYERKKWLATAIAVDTVRGPDSTGMFLAPHDKLVGVTPATLKGTCDGYAFVNDDSYRKQVANLDRYWAAVGHNRAATKGSVAIKNAHPFVRGPITLVHNGTVYNSDQLGDTKETDAEVDSDQICAALAENHVEDVAGLINGSFALVWHDKRDGKMRFLRNHERPLHLAATEDGSTIYFASEAEMLWFVSKRAGVRLRQPFQPNAGTLLTFSRDNLLVPEVTEVKLRPAVITYGQFGGQGRAADNVPFGRSQVGVATLGSPPTTTSTHSYQRLSGALEDELKKFRVIPDCTYTFLPTSYMQPPGVLNVCRLSGYIPAVEQNAIIWNINSAVASTALADKAPMAVKVVGLRYIVDKGNRVPLFICDYTGRGQGNDTLNRDVAGLKAGDTILGPEGKEVPTEWWCDAVGDGCSKCGVLILPEDADVITWDKLAEGVFNPVCNACSVKGVVQ